MKKGLELEPREIEHEVQGVFDYLMLSKVEMDRLHAKGFPTSHGLGRYTFEDDGSSDPAVRLADIREKVIEILTDQKLVDAGFILIPVEKPDVMGYNRKGQTQVVSYSKLGPAVLIEETWRNTRTGQPVKYWVGLERRHIDQLDINQRLSEELQAPTT